MAPSGTAPRFAKRLIAAAALATVTALALAACAGGTTSSSASAKNSVTILNPSINTQLAWDAGFSGSTSAFEMMNNNNAELIRKPYVATSQAGVTTQDISKFEGVLAKSYDVSSDGLVYTFHLRQGVKSQHGDELTSDDVIWSFDRKFGASTSITPFVVAPAITDPEKQFKKIDKYDFSITIARSGYGNILLSVIADVSGQIYDSTYLKKHATASDPYAVKWSANKYNFGFGPYDVTNVQGTTSVTMTADKNYALGTPKIKTLVFRGVSDPSVRAATLTRGDADVAETLNATSLNTLAKNSKFTVPSIDANDFLIASLVNTQKPFNDVKVRQAFAYAINYGQVVSQTYQGRATKTNTFLPSDEKGYDGSGLPNWSYDPTKAKSMLKAAGYPNGVSFTLSISSDDPAIQSAATQIQTSAASAGFTITINKLDTAAFSEGVQKGQFQASLKTDEAISLAPSYELNIYTAKGSTNNLAQYNSDAFRAAVEKGLAAGDATSTAAGQAWNEAEKIWLGQDVANVFIAKIKPSVAYSSDLTGWTNRTDNMIDFSVMSYKK